MKILPYMDTFTVFIVLTLVLSLGNLTVGTVSSIVAGVAGFLPPPLANNTIAAIAILALLGTIILKLLDAPPARLYRHGAKGARTRQFINRYGPEKGRYVYGATVGKVKRQRQANH